MWGVSYEFVRDKRGDGFVGTVDVEEPEAEDVLGDVDLAEAGVEGSVKGGGELVFDDLGVAEELVKGRVEADKPVLGGQRNRIRLGQRVEVLEAPARDPELDQRAVRDVPKLGVQVTLLDDLVLLDRSPLGKVHKPRVVCILLVNKRVLRSVCHVLPCERGGARHSSGDSTDSSP